MAADMSMPIFLWLSSTAGLCAAAAFVAILLQRQIAATARQIHRCAVHQRELLQIVENHRLLQDVQNVTESLVDEGTATVRTIHKEIANIPFEILESIPQTRDTTRVVRNVHDVASDSVYAGISVANRMLGRGIRKKMRVNEASKSSRDHIEATKAPEQAEQNTDRIEDKTKQ